MDSQAVRIGPWSGGWACGTEPSPVECDALSWVDSVRIELNFWMALVSQNCCGGTEASPAHTHVTKPKLYPVHNRTHHWHMDYASRKGFIQGFIQTNLRASPWRVGGWVSLRTRGQHVSGMKYANWIEGKAGAFLSEQACPFMGHMFKNVSVMNGGTSQGVPSQRLLSFAPGPFCTAARILPGLLLS